MMEKEILFNQLNNTVYDLIPIDKCLNIQTKELDIELYDIGQLIAHKLFEVLDKYTTAKTLTANQIGLDYKVMVINVREPLFFINPKILDEVKMIPYIEADNSYLGKLANTFRFGRVLVSALNFKSPIWFGVKSYQLDLLDNKYATTHPVIEECVAIQHGIDMLNNINMFERNEIYSYKQKKNPNRNDMVTIIKDNKELKIKYKKLIEFQNNGWTLKI